MSVRGSKKMQPIVSLVLVTLFILVPCLSAQPAKPASYSPSERPKDAPVLKTFPKDDAFFDRALHGVSKPYPSSLMFIKDQGPWFTPFNHPGMHGRFDIRGWHDENAYSKSLKTDAGSAPKK